MGVRRLLRLLGGALSLLGLLLMFALVFVPLCVVLVPLVLAYGWVGEPIWARVRVPRDRRLSRRECIERLSRREGTLVVDQSPLLGRAWWTPDVVDDGEVWHEGRVKLFELLRQHGRAIEFTRRYLDLYSSRAMLVLVWRAGKWGRDLKRSQPWTRIVMSNAQYKEAPAFECPACGYDLVGLEDREVCPECGRSLMVSLEEMER